MTDKKYNMLVVLRENFKALCWIWENHRTHAMLKTVGIGTFLFLFPFLFIMILSTQPDIPVSEVVFGTLVFFWSIMIFKLMFREITGKEHTDRIIEFWSLLFGDFYRTTFFLTLLAGTLFVVFEVSSIEIVGLETAITGNHIEKFSMSYFAFLLIIPTFAGFLCVDQTTAFADSIRKKVMSADLGGVFGISSIVATTLFCVWVVFSSLFGQYALIITPVIASVLGTYGGLLNRYVAEHIEGA